MEKTIYDVDYFIRKFEAIPEKLWCIDDQVNWKGQRCAYGHCNTGNRDEYIGWRQLDNLFSSSFEGHFIGKNARKQSTKLADVNNGYYREYQQTTPKKRILTALYDIKFKQQTTPVSEPKTDKIKTVYVSVPTTVIEESKELILS